MRAFVSRTGVAGIEGATWKWLGCFAPLPMMVFSLMLSGCASGPPRAADGTKAEEWGQCSHARPGANILCLEVRQRL